jgi:hypothetical protein
MSKRQHYELEGEGEDVATSPKRITPLNPSHSDQEALKALDKLSSYLGLDDLSAEGSAEGLEQTIFVDTEKASTLTDVQKQKLVEAVTNTTSLLAAIMAQASRSQGSVLALRDLQVNWNLPEDRRWTELGVWKSISRTTNQTLNRVANDLKKLKRKQVQESIAPKALSTISLLELFENTQKEE